MSLKLILCAVVLFIFNTSFIPGDNGELILGVWLYERSSKGHIDMVRYTEFKKDHSGVAFKRFGRLVMRQNASWCGAGPIVYKNYKGSWSMTSDTSLKMRYHYYGGIKEEIWQIHHLLGSNLTYHVSSQKVTKSNRD